MEQKLMQLQAKIEEDKSIGEKLFTFETPKEVQAFLSENGIEFSLEEIGVLRESIVKVAEKKDLGELSDEALDNVAGGNAGSVIGIIPWIVDRMADGVGAMDRWTGNRW